MLTQASTSDRLAHRRRCLLGSATLMIAIGLAAAPGIAQAPGASAPATAAPGAQDPAPFNPATQPEERGTANAVPATPSTPNNDALPVSGSGQRAELVASDQKDIVVTGSSIRGVAPVGSPLIGVTRDTIQAIAPANSKDLLASVPQLGNFGANAEQSTPTRFRTPGYQPNIHNLGQFATLTLINGHRIAPAGTEAVIPDPSIVPVIAVQRVEIIADGASSVYGSDAVAGVVNFIYRRNVNGIEASGTYGWNGSRYRKYDASMIAGKTWTGGGVLFAYEHSQSKSPLNSQIPTLALGGDQRSRGGRDLRSTNCLEPNVTVNGRAYGYSTSTGTFSTTRNVCTPYLDPLGQVIPDQRRDAFLLTAHQDVTDKIDVYAEGNFSDYHTFRHGGRPSLTVTIPSTNPYFRLPPGVVATSQTVVRSGLGLFPSGDQPQSDRFWGFTAGANWHVGSSWLINLFGTISQTKDFNIEAPELDGLAAIRLSAGTTTATAFNPFGQAADNNPNVLSQINDNYVQESHARQGLREIQIKGDGPLFALPGGDVRMAVGIDHRAELLNQLQLSGAAGVNQNVVRDDHIHRIVTSGFAEFNIPVFSQQNALPLLQSLTFSIAGRVDDYDRYGKIFNPKYGANWSPIRGVTIHGSYSTSFAAPNLGEITSSFSVPRPNSAINLTDVTTGTFLGTINQLNPGGGNPNLQPEKSTSKSIGADISPLRGLRLSATYYAVEYRNTVYQPTANDVLSNAAFAIYRTLNPTAAQIAALLAAYPNQGQITTGFDAIIFYNAQNIGVRRVAGVDIEASYHYETQKFGSFNLGLISNHQTKYEQQIAPGTPFNSRLNTNDAPSWKNRYQFGWELRPVTFNLFYNYVSSYRYTSVNPAQTVKSYKTFDVTVAMDLSRWLDHGVSLQGRVVNLTNRQPPFVDSAAGYIATLASPFGRQFELTLRAKL